MDITWSCDINNNAMSYAARSGGWDLEVSWEEPYATVMWTVSAPGLQPVSTVARGQVALGDDDDRLKEAFAAAKSAAIAATPLTRPAARVGHRSVYTVGGDVITQSGPGTMIVNTGNGTDS